MDWPTHLTEMESILNNFDSVNQEWSQQEDEAAWDQYHLDVITNPELAFPQIIDAHVGDVPQSRAIPKNFGLSGVEAATPTRTCG